MKTLVPLATVAILLPFTTDATSQKSYRYPLRPKLLPPSRAANDTGSRRLIMQLQENKDELFQGYGTHYVDLWIGCPTAQRQSVVIDTGSSDTGIPCSGCENCGAGNITDAYFQPALSTCFEQVFCNKGNNNCALGQCIVSDVQNANDMCAVYVQYADQSSWWGLEAVDRVSGSEPPATNKDTFRFRFACEVQQNFTFHDVADGIMGMDKTSMSFVSQAYEQGIIESRQFALCLSLQKNVKAPAGVLVMGGMDGRLHKTPMVYAKDFDSQIFYKVRLKKMYLSPGGGGDSSIQLLSRNDQQAQQQLVDIQINDGHLPIVDSGTTITYPPRTMERPFQAAWMQATGTTFGSAMSLSDAEFAALPTIIFQLEGCACPGNAAVPGLAGPVDPSNPNDTLIAFTPSRYLVQIGEGQYIYGLEFSHLADGILGANFMAGHDVFFDVENNRIGFAESQCDYGLVSSSAPSGNGSSVNDDLCANATCPTSNSNSIFPQWHAWIVAVAMLAVA